VSAVLVEINAGHAAPPGSTLVWHNGKQYAVMEGVQTGSTFIPSTYTGSYTGPTVDLTPLQLSISSLTNLAAQLDNRLQQQERTLGIMQEWIEELPNRLAQWTEEVNRVVNARFDEIDQALRLLLDE